MKTLSLLLFLSATIPMVKAAPVTFRGSERSTGSECGITYELDAQTEQVSSVNFFGNSSVKYVSNSELNVKKSFLGGFTKFLETQDSGPYPGDWSKTSLKVYGDLRAPRSFKYEYTKGRFLFSDSKTIDCL
jgi:hypothetical protein